MLDYQEVKQLEDDLWAAADQLRANSRLTASEYAMPVLGLIFLRHATTRFHALLPEVERNIPARATGALREERIRLGFQGKAAIYLPETARYDHLAALPAGAHVGEAIRDAMIAIEDSVTDQNGNKLLAGALPKDYLGLERDLLAELGKKEAGETISNANSLWIQYFYSYLNASGRAGFVMASSASDAGNKDREIRQKLVETGHVDVMISIGSKFFYTRSLPCTLWFFDRGKPDDLLDSVLMIDARQVYTVVSPRSHVFTEEQLANLSAITWLYRGEHKKFVELLGRYHHEVGQWLTAMPERLAADSATVTALAGVLANLARRTADGAAVATVREKLGEGHGLTDELLAAYREDLARLQDDADGWQLRLQAALDGAAQRLPDIRRCRPDSNLAARKALQAAIEAINPPLKAALATLEARHKAWLKLLETAEKSLRARQWPGFDGDTAREARRALLPRDLKKREAPTVRDLAVEACRRASYFIAQGHWLLSRFPNGWYDDVPGLCKAVAREEIAANDWSLTPGRYVGSAAAIVEDDEGEGFRTRMREIHGELAGLNDSAQKLGLQIQVLLAEVFA